MTHKEFLLEFTDSYYKLLELYNSISNDIIHLEGRINYNEYEVNNNIGDITKNIKWTWAINNKSLGLFRNSIKNILPDINLFFKNEFDIIGASFITLYEQAVINPDFHYDITSHNDIKFETNILTLIFPLYIDDDMGNLEYIENKATKIYTYKKNKAFVFDSCKLKHRTQPYTLNEPKKRVLVSLNFSSKSKWAIKEVTKSLKYQGNY